MIDIKAQLEEALKKLNLGKNKRETYMILGVGAAFIGVLYFNFMIRPKLDEMGKNGKEIRTLRAELDQIKNSVSREPALKSSYDNMIGKVQSYEKRLPAKTEIPLLLEQLSKIARETGVKILAITPSNVKKTKVEKEDKPYVEIPISVTAQGGYHELGTFLNRMEKSDRFMKIAELLISTNSQDKKSHNLEMIVSTYVLLKD